MTTTNIAPLPKQVVEEDHRLDKAASGSAVALMKLRWHWTLDESNAKRVPIRQYARETGRGDRLIYRDTTAYDLLRTGTCKTPEEARERAQMGAESFAAVKAVAEARGVGAHTARQRHKDEVRHVREVARERAERKGTTPEQELANVAQEAVRAERARQRETTERRKHFGSQYLKADGKFIDAARKMAEGIDALEGADLDREEWELLFHTIDQVIEFANLAKTARRKSGDWSKKFEVLKGGIAS